MIRWNFISTSSSTEGTIQSGCAGGRKNRCRGRASKRGFPDWWIPESYRIDQGADWSGRAGGAPLNEALRVCLTRRYRIDELRKLKFHYKLVAYITVSMAILWYFWPINLNQRVYETKVSLYKLLAYVTVSMAILWYFWRKFNQRVYELKFHY